jgi:aspartyl-tRNA(Asn)/glutamyl-tRNA(Gln) amidotransferase subunit A
MSEATHDSGALSPIRRLQQELLHGEADPLSAASRALDRANSNAGENVYLATDREWTLAEAAGLARRFPDASSRPSLHGLPISLKDCFDLAGFPTSCGSRFYAEHHGIAAADSWVAEKLRSRGAVIPGKTHLHQLAYGITGENADYGDCAQPHNAAWLTGGSSSGAAASVQEGSAVAAIGTDTGGSIRAPAALCGLAGYRASLGLGLQLDVWRGAAHLAPSFDTLGWLFRDLRDAPLLANALFDLPIPTHPAERPVRIGEVGPTFLHDAEPRVLEAFDRFQQELRKLGISVENFDSGFWNESFEIFAPIQASEAAVIHAGFFDHFEPAIASRLAWGASIPGEELHRLRDRHRIFRTSFDRLFDRYDFLIVPCTPVSSLALGADHSETRGRILRYTTPASLAGTPVVAVPLDGAGIQLIARHGGDAALVAFAAYLGKRLASQILLSITKSQC